MIASIPPLYKKFFMDKEDEREELFTLLADRFSVKKGLYPGSFVHITPSFVIQEMVYVDKDRRFKKFFTDPETLRYINGRKTYPAAAIVRYHAQDFTENIPEREQYFDLLISLYAGFISERCKQHLRKNGVLLVNNSHGDATLVSLDPDYTLAGVVKRNGNNFRYSEDDLESYFIPKNGGPIDEEQVRGTMKGIGFAKTGYAYVFIKTI